MKKNILFLISATVGLVAATPIPVVDCKAIYNSVKSVAKADKSKVLEIVSTQTTATPSCVCEIIRASIEATKPNPAEVAAIVEAAVIAAPEEMSAISQCAVAAAPDALGAVQAVLARLGVSASAISAIFANAPGNANAPDSAGASFNPLDFPGRGPVGPIPGGPGGMPIIPNLPPFIVAPPDVSNVNP